MRIRPPIAVVAGAALTAVVGLAVASSAPFARPEAFAAAVAFVALANAFVWPSVVVGRRPGMRAVCAGLVASAAAGAMFASVPQALLSFDRFAGGPSVGLALVALPVCAVVATLASIGGTTLAAGDDR